MIKKILQWPNPKLLEISKEINPNNIKNKIYQELINNMIETMYDGNGVGLAAIQIGIPKRIFILDVGFGPEIYINPKITNYGPNQLVERMEGCLSIKGFFEKVKRYTYVLGTCYNENGNMKIFTSNEIGTNEQVLLRAQGIQHENMHLDGKIFIDEFSYNKKIKFLK